MGLWASWTKAHQLFALMASINVRIGTPDTPLVTRRSDRIRKQMVERVKDGRNIVAIVILTQMVYCQRV